MGEEDAEREGGVAGWGLGEEKQNISSSKRGPGGAGPPKQCYFISLTEHNNQGAFHHLSYRVIISFLAITSTCIPINLCV